jgi:hypothetical protein
MFGAADEGKESLHATAEARSVWGAFSLRIPNSGGPSVATAWFFQTAPHVGREIHLA